MVMVVVLMIVVFPVMLWTKLRHAPVMQAAAKNNGDILDGALGDHVGSWMARGTRIPAVQLSAIAPAQHRTRRAEVSRTASRTTGRPDCRMVNDLAWTVQIVNAIAIQSMKRNQLCFARRAMIASHAKLTRKYLRW
ncbi:hypothetical protein [Bradyrhizobium genosp. A]|uniref:hypothetical protein n=1 Tax=Bradyrhizobium genosp. A TaxID=83626 RepID=UPI003CEDA8C7